MEKWAECRINLNVDLRAKPTRVVDGGEVRMKAVVVQSATAPCEPPRTLVIKGADLGRVMGLIAMTHKDDETLASMARRVGPLAEKVAGRTDAECADLLRSLVIEELEAMARKDGRPNAGLGD